MYDILPIYNIYLARNNVVLSFRWPPINLQTSSNATAKNNRDVWSSRRSEREIDMVAIDDAALWYHDFDSSILILLTFQNMAMGDGAQIVT